MRRDRGSGGTDRWTARRRAAGEPGRDRPRLPRLLAMLALVLSGAAWALPAASLPAAAQSSEGYVAPTYGYGLTVSSDDWVIETDSGPTGDSTRDFLRLESNDADDEGLISGIVFVEGTGQEWSDPDDCVRTLAREIGVRPSSDEPIDDPDTGEPYAISGPDRAAAAYIRTDETEDGDEGGQGALFECVADPDSDLIVAFTNVSAYTDRYFDLGYPPFAALIETLTFPGGGTAGGDGDSSDSGKGEEIPAGGGSPGEPEPSAAASDDPGPTQTGESDDPAPSATDDPAPSAVDDPTATTFIAEEFGVELGWDPAIWQSDGEERGEGYAAVRLSSEILAAVVVPYRSGDGSVQTCLDNYVAILDERGAGTASIVQSDGEDAVQVSEDGTRLTAYVGYTDKDVESVSVILCFSLNATDVLAVEFSGPVSDVFEDEATDQIDSLLGGLRVAGQT